MTRTNKDRERLELELDLEQLFIDAESHIGGGAGRLADAAMKRIVEFTGSDWLCNACGARNGGVPDPPPSTPGLAERLSRTIQLFVHEPEHLHGSWRDCEEGPCRYLRRAFPQGSPRPAARGVGRGGIMSGKARDCAGFRKSGHWKGWPCGTSPTLESHGYWWCRNHVPLNEEEAADAVRDRKAWEEQQAARS